MEMETRKFRLDTAEHDTVTRLLKAFFGIVCFVSSIVTFVVMSRAGQLPTVTIAAIVFLFLFGVWLILAGSGLTERYMIISGDVIILKESLLSRARRLKASGIRMIEFSQLKVSFFLEGGEVIHLRLGAYYRESSLRLMETMEEYSSLYGVATKGIIPDNEEGNHEG